MINKLDIFSLTTSLILEKAKNNINFNDSTYPDILNEEKEESDIFPFMNKSAFAGWILFDTKSNLTFSKDYITNNIGDDYINGFSEFNLDEYFDFIFSSYSSIFTVEEIEGSYIYLRDLILNVKIKAYDSQHFINKEFNNYFLRVSKYQNEYVIVQINTSFNDDFKDFFIKDLRDYLNYEKINIKKFSDMKSYLKENLINIFYVYGSSLSDYSTYVQERFDEDQENRFLNMAFSKEDKELFNKFSLSLSNSTKNFQLNRDEIMYYVSLIYDEYLKNNDLNYSSYKDLDFKKIYYELSLRGQFCNLSELNNSLMLFKNYYLYIKKYNKNFDDLPIKSIDKAIDNTFIYQNLLQNSIEGYFVDETLLDIIKNSYFEESKFINEFENFIDYIQYYYLYENKNGELSPAVVKSISKELGLKSTKNVKNLREYHFPELMVFLKFAKIKNIISVEKENLFKHGLYELSSNAYKYLNLDYNEKLALWFSTLINKEFYRDMYSQNKIYKIKKFMIDLFVKIDENKLKKNYSYQGEYEPIIGILIDLGIFKDFDKLEFTNLGKKIFKYYNKLIPIKNIIIIDFKK